MSGYERSPAPPSAPPPSRETDIAFGAILIITGIIVLVFFGYLIVRQSRAGEVPATKTDIPPAVNSVAYEYDNFKKDSEYVDSKANTWSLRSQAVIPSTVLRPFKL